MATVEPRSRVTGTGEPDPAREAKEEDKVQEQAVKNAQAPDLKTGRIISSDERRTYSGVDEKELSKEDKEALEMDARVVRMVSFTTTYAVQADSDEAAIEAVKRDPSKFPFSEPTVNIQSRAAASATGFMLGKDYEKRAEARAKQEAERRERVAKETADARNSAAQATPHTHPAPATNTPGTKN